MFRAKDAASIRRIQSAFQCCGLRTTRDRAWPFPDANHDAGACVQSFGHSVSCLDGWRGEERRAAGMLLAVAVLVLLWQVRFELYIVKRDSH